MLTTVVFACACAASGDEWPRFRGPNGQGVAVGSAPTTWGEGKNIKWTAAVPAEGWSSPVLGDGRIYLTGTTDGGTRCHVLAYAVDTGKLIWDREVLTQNPTRKEGKNSFATPTPVYAEGSVYAVFGQGGIVAVDAASGAGKWTFAEVEHYSQHGLGASPVVWRNLVIMPYDGSSPGPDKKVGWQTPWEKAQLVALDAKTGKVVWQAGRGPSRIGHSTPMILSAGGKDVLVSQGGDVVQGFDPATGERLWSVANAGEGLVPSPVLADGKFITTPGWPTPAIRAWAVKAGGLPELAWERSKNVPMLPSAVFVNGLLFGVTEKGIATALDPATGAVKWEERLNGSFSASLVAAGGKVYATNEAGETTVFVAGPEWKPLGKNKLSGVFQATPAIVGGHIYLRSDQRLFCVGE